MLQVNYFIGEIKDEIKECLLESLSEKDSGRCKLNSSYSSDTESLPKVYDTKPTEFGRIGAVLWGGMHVVRHPKKRNRKE